MSVEGVLQCVSMLPMLTGDAKTNPSPVIVKQMLEQLLKGQKTMSKDIREIETTQQSFSKQLNAVNQKILEMEITLTL